MTGNLDKFSQRFDVNIIAMHCDELAKFNSPIRDNKLSGEQEKELVHILEKAWKGPESSQNFASQKEFDLHIEGIYKKMVTKNAVIITEKMIKYGGTTLSKVKATRQVMNKEFYKARGTELDPSKKNKKYKNVKRNTLPKQDWTLGGNHDLMKGAKPNKALIRHEVATYENEAPKKNYTPVLAEAEKFSKDYYQPTKKTMTPDQIAYRSSRMLEGQEKMIIQTLRDPDGKWKPNTESGAINYQMWPMRIRDFFGVYEDTYPETLDQVPTSGTEKHQVVKESITAEIQELIAEHIPNNEMQQKTMEMLEKFVSRYEACGFELTENLSAVELYIFYRTVGMYMIWQTVIDHRTLPGSIHDINHSHANDHHADECASGLIEDDQSATQDFLMTFTNLFHDMAYIEPVAVSHDKWFLAAGDHPIHSARSLYENRNFFEKFIPPPLLALAEDTIATHGLPTGRGASIGEFEDKKDEFGINERHFKHVFRACDECATSYKEKSCRVVKLPTVVSNILRTQILRTHVSGKDETSYVSNRHLEKLDTHSKKMKESIKRTVLTEGVKADPGLSHIQSSKINLAVDEQFSAITQKVALEQVGGDLERLQLEFTGAIFPVDQKYRITAFMNLCHTTGVLVGLGPAGEKDYPIFWNSIGKFYKDCGGDIKEMERQMRQMRRNIVEGKQEKAKRCSGEYGDVVINPKFVELTEELFAVFNFLEHHSLLPALGDMEYDLHQAITQMKEAPTEPTPSFEKMPEGSKKGIAEYMTKAFKSNITKHAERIHLHEKEKIDKLVKVFDSYVKKIESLPEPLTGAEVIKLLEEYIKEIRTVDVMTKEEEEFVRSGKIVENI